MNNDENAHRYESKRDRERERGERKCTCTLKIFTHIDNVHYCSYTLKCSNALNMFMHIEMFKRIENVHTH